MPALAHSPVRLRDVAFAVACLAAAGPLAAATISWVNPGTGDWQVAPNWGGTVPGAVDDARILNGGTALLNSGLATVRSLQIGGPGLGSTLRMQGGPAALQVVEGSLTVGRSATGLTGIGTLAGNAGTLEMRSPANGLGIIDIGRADGGSAVGEAVIGRVVSERLAGVSVGTARGGAAVGTLSVLNGDLDLHGGVQVGTVLNDAGGQAEGTLTLAGTLQGGPSGAGLNVGQVFRGPGPDGTGGARAVGRATTTGLRDVVGVGVGTTAVSRGDGVTADGTLTSGGIVNTLPGGSFQVGRALGASTSAGGVQTVWGAATARGTATVTGGLRGYDNLDVGFAVISGRADGRLTVTDGDVTVGSLRIATALGLPGAVTVIDGALDARGQMTLRRGALDLGGGTASVGSVLNPVVGLPMAADGTLVLDRATLAGGRLDIGIGSGATGRVELLGAGSAATLRSLSLGAGAGASGTLVLDGARLAVADADPVVGSITVGSNGGHARLQGTDAQVQLSGNLSIGGFTDAGGDGRMQLTRSTLDVGGGVGIGDAGATSIAELSLVDSVATVAGNLRVGLGADARLVVDASSLVIGDTFTMNAAADLVFGIDGLMPGFLGHGAIEAADAVLAGDLLVDFSDLALGMLPADPVIHLDLITAAGGRFGIFGDFASVNFLAPPTGYDLSWGTVVDGAEIWRLTLTRQDRGGGGTVPEPSSLALLAAAALAAALAGTRRRRHG